MSRGTGGVRPLLLRVVVAGLTLALCLSLAELGVRRVYRDVTTTRDYKSWFARRWRRTAEMRRNALGFREREIAWPKPVGVRRIAVVGDSCTYGQGIDEADRFSNRIDDALNAGVGEGAGRFEVLNFGKPGAETIDHLRIVREQVLPVGPDFVLLQWYPNDVEGHDKSGRPSPLNLAPSAWLHNQLHTKSALYYLANAQWGNLQTALGTSTGYVEYMQRRFGDPASTDAVEADRALQEVIRLCRDHGVGLGMVLFPTLAVGKDYPLQFLHERVLARCAAEGVSCLDLAPVLLSVPDSHGLWANRLDSHPGPEANRIAAERILAFFGPALSGRTR